MQPKCDNPIMIGGSGSCGSSLLAHLLNCHRGIFCGPELNLLIHPELYRRFAGFSDHDKQRMVEAFDSFPGIVPHLLGNSGSGAREHNKGPRVHSFVKRLDEAMGMDPAQLYRTARASRTFRDFVDRIFAVVLERAGKPRWAEKTPLNCFAIGEFLETYPNGRYLHLIRDGRDVARSLARRRFDLKRGTQRWLYDNALFLPFRRHPRCLLVYYEALVGQPRQTLARLLEFLGEDPGEAGLMLEAAPERDVVTVQHAVWEQSPSEGISARSVGQWKQLSRSRRAQLAFYFHHLHLSPATVRRVATPGPVNANALMRLYGYDLPDGWETQPKFGARRLVYAARRYLPVARQDNPYFVYDPD